MELMGSSSSIGGCLALVRKEYFQYNVASVIWFAMSGTTGHVLQTGL